MKLIYLERHDAAKNMHRFYQMHVVLGTDIPHSLVGKIIILYLFDIYDNVKFSLDLDNDRIATKANLKRRYESWMAA